jgi:hypothetical protein
MRTGAKDAILHGRPSLPHRGRYLRTLLTLISRRPTVAATTTNRESDCKGADRKVRHGGVHMHRGLRSAQPWPEAARSCLATARDRQQHDELNTDRG